MASSVKASDFILMKEDSKMREQNRLFSLMTLAATLIGFVLLLFAAGPSFKGEVLRPAAIKNVRVFDGEKMIPPSTVVIDGGKIVGIGERISIPENAEMIDGAGKTLLPGFIDSHVHVWDKQNLRQSLVFGVTAVVDMFTSVQAMSEIKKIQSEGRAEGMSFMISPGILATAPGGHGTQYGLPIPTITGPEQAQSFVDARIAEGSDFIKLIYDDGRAYGMSRPTISKETLAAIVKAAHLRGKLAIVHAATLQNSLDSLEAGADGLAHLFFDDAYAPEFGKLAARKKAFVIPTLSVLRMMAGLSDGESLIQDALLASYLKPGGIQNLRSSFPFKTSEINYRAAEKALRQLKETGVPILAGTDAPNPGTTYGASLHRELVLLVQGGLTPIEALKAATSVPADKFKLEGRGRIKPGLIADLVLVKGDPSKEITATRDIVSVWKNGTVVDRPKYLDEVKKDKESAELLKKAPFPEHSESGLISDFEGENIEAKFGAGWIISTDRMMGGKSTAQYTLADGGAQGSKKSLLITGTIVLESVQNWAGALFSPGQTMMAPANLSFKKSISFWAKGDGKRYAAMVFAQSLGFIPAIQFFEVGPEWKEYVFPYEKFGIEGFDIMGIFIGASGEKGEFSLQIDNVCLK